MIKNTEGYRFGFNGKENDNEIKGTGNQQDYGMRIYDPRLGRFLSIDPLTDKYPNLTPYQFASNRCIDGVDWDGLEYRKSPGIFHHYSSGWDINPSQLPEFYKNLGVTNKAQLEKQVTNTRQKLGNMNTDNYKSVTEGRDAGENLAEKGLNMLVQFTPEVKALNEVESQGEELRGANWVFNRAEQQGLIPSEFKTDNQFANDVVNFLYDGSLPQGEGPKGDIYKSIISDLGKEIYENRKKVIQGTYSGQYIDKKKEIIVPTPSGLDNYRNNDVYKPRIIDTGKKTPLTDRLKQFFNLKSGCTNCPVIKKTPGSV